MASFAMSSIPCPYAFDLIATAKRVFGDRIERNDCILFETALREISTRVGANKTNPARIYLA